MDLTLLIYVAMAALCLYSLVGWKGQGLISLIGAGSELASWAGILRNTDNALNIRNGILSRNYGSADDQVTFRNKTLREAMEGYCAAVSRMSLSRQSKYQCDIEDFFHRDLLDILGNSNFVEHACSALTGLGILGTFIGMTNGLSGFDTQDAQSALESINIMTGGMHYAFMTSIVGIILSLALGTVHRVILHNAEQKLGMFVDVFQKNVLSDQHEAGFNQLLSHLSNIVIRLESKAEVDENRMVLFADRFIASIRSQLELDVRAMKESMEQFNQQQQLFAASVNEFSKQIDTISGEIRNVGSGFDRLVVQSEDLAKNLEKSGTMVAAGVQKLHEMVEADARIIENNRQLSEQLQESAAELTGLVNNVNTQSLNTADVVRKLSEYTAAAVDETAAGCNKLVEMHYGELKDRMTSLMDMAQAQTTRLQDEGMTQLSQIRQENERIKEEICHEGAEILGAIQRVTEEQTQQLRNNNQQIVEEMRSTTNSAMRSVSDSARKHVLDMPQTKYLRQELDSIVQTQNDIIQYLKKRNSLFVKMIQALRREE